MIILEPSAFPPHGKNIVERSQVSQIKMEVNIHIKKEQTCLDSDIWKGKRCLWKKLAGAFVNTSVLSQAMLTTREFLLREIPRGLSCI